MSNEMGRKQERSAEKTSNFAVTCSLLSQYIKEKGRSLGDLGLGMAPRPLDAAIGKAETYRPPTTMSLLPGVDVSGAGTKDDVSDRNASRSMELFPQRAGFGLSGPPADSDRKTADTREPEKAQLTIFYGGKVLVFDSFPADKAKDLMQLAGKGSGSANNFGFVPPSSVTGAAVGGQTLPSNRSSNLVSTPSNSPDIVQSRPEKATQPNVSDLPIARKASLHRFLEKRKDRINAKAPYQAKDSAASISTAKPEESKPWLGLSPQFVKPSGNTECSR